MHVQSWATCGTPLLRTRERKGRLGARVLTEEEPCGSPFVAPDQPILVTCRVQDKQGGFGVKSWLAEFGGKKNSYGLLQGWNFELSVYYFESQSPSRSLSLALSSSLSVYELRLASLRERFFRGNAALCALKWYQDLKVELFAVGVWILC